MEDDLLVCPITKLIYKDPVLAEDGYIYEYDAIKIHLLNKNTSPTTGLTITKNLIRVYPIKKYIDGLLKLKPDLKSSQYISKKPFITNKLEIINILKNNQLEKLFDYNMFQLNSKLESESLIEFLSKNKNFDEKILKYILDNSIDYDTYDILEPTEYQDEKKK